MEELPVYSELFLLHVNKSLAAQHLHANEMLTVQSLFAEQVPMNEQ